MKEIALNLQKMGGFFFGSGPGGHGTKKSLSGAPSHMRLATVGNHVSIRRVAWSFLDVLGSRPHEDRTNECDSDVGYSQFFTFIKKEKKIYCELPLIIGIWPRLSLTKRRESVGSVWND